MIHRLLKRAALWDQKKNNTKFKATCNLAGMFICMLHSYSRKILTTAHATHVETILTYKSGEPHNEFRERVLVELEQMAANHTIPIDNDESFDFALETISFDRSNTQMTDSAVFRPDLYEIEVDDNTMVGPHYWKDIRDEVMDSFNPNAISWVSDLSPAARDTLDILMNRQASVGAKVSLNSSGGGTATTVGGAQASTGGGNATTAGGAQASTGRGNATTEGGNATGGGDATGGGGQTNIGESNATASGASGVQTNPTQVAEGVNTSTFGAGQDE